jgi:hypothetical protein
VLFDTDLRFPGEDDGRQLEQTLTSSSSIWAQYLLKALYFAAVAVRLLRPEELFDVVHHALAALEHAQATPRCSYELLELVQDHLMVSATGRISFRSASMRRFLLQSRYVAAENGHETMARSCLQYLSEDDEFSVLRPYGGFSRMSSRAQRRPFVRYAAIHWQRHYRLSESECNNLPALLHQRLQHEVKTSCSSSGYLHIEVQKLGLRLGLALCIYYSFEFLKSIYVQMGAQEGSGPGEMSSAFPSGLECRALSSNPRRIRTSIANSKADSRATNWADSLTDGESELEDSWASISARPQLEQWVSDFNDLRLGLDEPVFVNHGYRKGEEDGWEVIDRQRGLEL